MIYKTRRGYKFKRYFLLLISASLVVLCVFQFEKQVAVFSKNYIPSFAHRISTEAVCGAVNNVISELGLEYGDIANISYDNSGSIRSITTESSKINMLKAKATKAAQDELVKIKHSTMKVPLGAFTGLTLLSNSGPEVNLTFCMTGSFNSRIESSFEGAGLNQTIHQIKLVMSAEIVTASVDYDGVIKFETDFEIAQSVIVGEIPTTYGGYYASYK